MFDRSPIVLKKDEEEMEDFHDYEDEEHSDMGSKLDDFDDAEDEEDGLEVLDEGHLGESPRVACAPDVPVQGDGLVNSSTRRRESLPWRDAHV